MSPNEKLTEAAGQKLGAALNVFSGKAKYLELDIEPVKDPATLVEFLKGVREKLSPDLKLTIAAPFVSDKKSEANSWTRAQFEHVIPYVDGLELMVYDTGAKTKEEFLSHIQNNSDAVGAWQELYPAKKFLMGLPAYPDKTKLHRPEIENLAVVNERAKTLNNAVAIYAGWTLTETDQRQMEKLVEKRTVPKRP